MNRIFRLAAVALALSAALAWLGLGANRGWTRTTVPVKVLDEVTGIEGIEYRKQFVPGLDLLGAALCGATMLTAISLVFRNQQTKESNP